MFEDMKPPGYGGHKPDQDPDLGKMVEGTWKFLSGLKPRFDLLRASQELSSTDPKIKAKGEFRIAKFFAAHGDEWQGEFRGNVLAALRDGFYVTGAQEILRRAPDPTLDLTLADIARHSNDPDGKRALEVLLLRRTPEARRQISYIVDGWHNASSAALVPKILSEDPDYKTSASVPQLLFIASDRSDGDSQKLARMNLREILADSAKNPEALRAIIDTVRMKSVSNSLFEAVARTIDDKGDLLSGICEIVRQREFSESATISKFALIILSVRSSKALREAVEIAETKPDSELGKILLEAFWQRLERNPSWPELKAAASPDKLSQSAVAPHRLRLEAFGDIASPHSTGIDEGLPFTSQEIVKTARDVYEILKPAFLNRALPAKIAAPPGHLEVIGIKLGNLIPGLSEMRYAALPEHWHAEEKHRTSVIYDGLGLLRLMIDIDQSPSKGVGPVPAVTLVDCLSDPTTPKVASFFELPQSSRLLRSIDDFDITSAGAAVAIASRDKQTAEYSIITPGENGMLHCSNQWGGRGAFTLDDLIQGKVLVRSLTSEELSNLPSSLRSELPRFKSKKAADDEANPSGGFDANLRLSLCGGLRADLIERKEELERQQRERRALEEEQKKQVANTNTPNPLHHLLLRQTMILSEWRKHRSECFDYYREWDRRIARQREALELSQERDHHRIWRGR